MKNVIVVGSGIAGLIAALELSTKYDVTLVTKSELAESNTRWAQGGIAAAMFDDDSVAEHIADTLRAGAGLCNQAVVEVLCSEGPDRIRDLIRLGVDFDHRDGQLARGLEAAHSRARVLHAGGDATGLTIEMALVRAVRKANVRVLEHTFACDLLLNDERVTGLEILDASNNRVRLSADAVILASGGAGQLYLHTTNPAVATGDGVAMALRAGAQLADVEFYQFHPTALAMPGTFLISEAVRGEGAVLLDAHGRRFMQSLHADAELAPRDVVARGIAMQMAEQGGKPVLLDATAMGADFLRSRFPTIDAACRSRGLDWAKNPIPVTPAAHYWMGGVRTDGWGRTSIRGLFAVGEVACTGVHGANRLASNSLLESLVFAWRCAHLLLSETSIADTNSDWPSLTETGVIAIEDSQTATVNLPRREDLQRLMWNAAGIERNGEGLQTAAARLDKWHVEGTSVEALETANLLVLARVLVAAALERRESRGAHYRTDYIETSAAWQHSLSFARKVTVAC
jgi:L-aspartate oxidase